MKRITILLIIFYFSGNNFVICQNSFQTFQSAGFKVKCNCQLRVNSTFIQMAKQQGKNNVIAAYICSENEKNPDIGVIVNINIYNEFSTYNKIPSSMHASYEKKYLEEYAKNLSISGIKYNYTKYQGVSAIEYTFNQMGSLPTKAIVFLKNKKSYLIQVATRSKLLGKYNYVKSNFIII